MENTTILIMFGTIAYLLLSLIMISFFCGYMLFQKKLENKYKKHLSREQTNWLLTTLEVEYNIKPKK